MFKESLPLITINLTLCPRILLNELSLISCRDSCMFTNGTDEKCSFAFAHFAMRGIAFRLLWFSGFVPNGIHVPVETKKLSKPITCFACLLELKNHINLLKLLKNHIIYCFWLFFRTFTSCEPFVAYLGTKMNSLI